VSAEARVQLPAWAVLPQARAEAQPEASEEALLETAATGQRPPKPASAQAVQAEPGRSGT